MSNILSIVGLCLDIVGVILIFFNGLPPKVISGPHMDRKIWEKHQYNFGDRDLYIKNRCTIFWAKFGLILIIVGFALQLSAYLLSLAMQ